jgi:hypothetical protein
MRDRPTPDGTTVLVLGIVSLVLCHLLGPVAWSMANAELRRIDEGIVSPHGRGNVVAGRVLGIVSTCLMIFALLLIAVIVATSRR